MKILKVALLTLLVSRSIDAQSLEVSAEQVVCDGPFVNTGDISRLNRVIKEVKESLKDECLRQNPHGFSMLKGLDRITRFETTYGTMHCLEIEVVDQCFIR